MKKNKPKAMIRLNIINFNNELENTLLTKLKELLENKKDQVLEVSIFNVEEYWKIPGRTDCFFAIYSPTKVSIKNLIETLGLKWYYSVGPTYNVKNPKERIENNEDAVWDQATHGGTLLHVNVKWANMYTWSE